MELLPGIYDQILVRILSSKLKLDDKHMSLLLRYFKDLSSASFVYIPKDNRIDFISSVFKNLSLHLQPETEFENVCNLMLQSFLHSGKELNGLENKLKEIKPFTAVTVSNFYTSSRKSDIYSELKKEISSSDMIYISVQKNSELDFIKSSLEDFVKNGKKLRIITSNPDKDIFSAEIKTYQGDNAQAATFLFIRNSGYHTLFIGSNFLPSRVSEWKFKANQFENPDVVNSVLKSFDSRWNMLK